MKGGGIFLTHPEFSAEQLSRVLGQELGKQGAQFTKLDCREECIGMTSKQLLVLPTVKLFVEQKNKQTRVRKVIAHDSVQ